MTVKQAEAAYSAAQAGLYMAECERDLKSAQELVRLAFKALEDARMTKPPAPTPEVKK